MKLSPTVTITVQIVTLKYKMSMSTSEIFGDPGIGTMCLIDLCHHILLHSTEMEANIHAHQFERKNTI